MNPPTDVERKVRQLDEDVLTIYDMLGTIKDTQQHHSQLLHNVGQRLDTIDTRLDGVDQRLDTIDTRFDGVDQRLDTIDTRFDGMDSKLNEVLELLRPRENG